MPQHNTTARASRRADGHFTMIANAAIRDPRLSWKAKGILAGALSHGPGFKFNREWFVEHSTDGMAAVRSAFQELREHGYLITEHYRRADGDAFSPRLHFSDDPAMLAEGPQDGGISNVAENQPGWKATRSETSHVLRRSKIQEEQSEEDHLDTPYPLKGDEQGQDAELVAFRARLEGRAPGGTLVAVPQAQDPAPSPPKRNRMAKPSAFTPTPDDIPAALLPVEAPLMAFWAEKGGQRTKAAWTALLGNLERIQGHPDGGTQVVAQQLDNAIQSGWTSVTFSNWQKWGQPAPARSGSRSGSASPKGPDAWDAVTEFANWRDGLQQDPNTMRHAI